VLLVTATSQAPPSSPQNLRGYGAPNTPFLQNTNNITRASPGTFHYPIPGRRSPVRLPAPPENSPALAFTPYKLAQSPIPHGPTPCCPPSARYTAQPFPPRHTTPESNLSPTRHSQYLPATDGRRTSRAHAHGRVRAVRTADNVQAHGAGTWRWTGSRRRNWYVHTL
jgi:hypothetical protein